MSDEHDASPDDIARVSAALREITPTSGEPDWAKVSSDIGAAVDGAARTQRRTRMWGIGGAVLAAAAVAALLVWPVARGRNDSKNEAQAKASVDAAPVEELTTEDEIDADDVIAEEMAVPDDLGGITLDEELIDEAAAALDEELGDEEDDLDERLLPDGAWIDELSDDDLERAVAILDGEAG